MKKIVWSLLCFSLSLALAGQRNGDYGAFMGISSYIGDINPGRPFYAPKPAAGIFYRYNFNPREAVRLSLFYGGLQGSDADFQNDFQKKTRNASFSGSVGECSLQFEFNFLTYSTQGKLWNYTPYFATGIAAAFVNLSHSTYSAGKFVATPAIPFTFGFKINIHKNLGLEAEYGFRKTFYDNFDGLNNNSVALAGRSDIIHNNDWYSYAGISLTWKIYSKLAGCPAFDDVDKKR
jgi:hypothetical protein